MAKNNSKYAHDLGIFGDGERSIVANADNPAIVAAVIMAEADSNAVTRCMQTLFEYGTAWYEGNDPTTLALFVLLSDIAEIHYLDPDDYLGCIDHRFAVSFAIPGFKISEDEDND